MVQEAFLHLVDLTILNSCILLNLKKGKMKTGKKPQLVDFRLSVIRQILEEFTPERLNTTGGRKSKDPVPLSLSARHFPEAIPTTESKGKPRWACHVCRWTAVGQQWRKDTTWWCRDCDVPLCLPDCFRNFHSKRIF